MNRRYVIAMISLVMLLAGCSIEQTSETSREEDLEREREILEQRAQEYLEEQRNASEPAREEPEQPQKDEVFRENTSDDANADESTEEEDPVVVDIAIRDVDVDVPSSFDLEDDEVTFEVAASIVGLEDGTSFVGEVVILEEFGTSCQFIIQTGEDEQGECSLEDFPNHGTYEYEVFLDIKEQFNESDYDNNYLRDEFELEDE